jgi:precorrin-2 dehydrogenase / sirohydrochlorin ferrochelatase
VDGLIHYPVFFDLRDRPVLMVGAGRVALRKARGLVEAGARVKVVAERWEAGFDALEVERARRKFEPADLEGAFLAFAATDDRAVNAAVAAEAKRRGIPVNVADAPAECDFILPARVRRGRVQVAVSTGGEDPRRAVELRRRIEHALDE